LARFMTAGALALVAHGLVGVYLAMSGALANLSASALPALVEGLDAREAASEEPLSVESLVEELERPVTPSVHERKVEKEQNEKDAKGQVVDIAQPSIEQRPDKANYVAEYDSTVNRETKGPLGLDKAGAVLPGAVVTPKGEPTKRPTPLSSAASPPTPEQTMLAMRSPVGTKVPGPAGP
jgi:hypothetical protein